MLRTSVPSEPPKLGPDRSASYWTRRVIVCQVGSLVSMPGMLIGAYLSSPLHEILIFGALGGLLAFAGAGVLASQQSVGAIHNEEYYGYTTLYGREYRHLWHLDPKTGAVIRRPDEDEK